ncbi:uncharacterized protein N0V89_010562 [Didymosphaeria variabile]|uniref:Glycosyltransferase family 25 protein n=1 Tax=Didymosphaeria variabile TaxID=1932322 RepID=A0A9W8XBI3_9PLEO|nr:uncharacterized protein N0V89_010562 [Didymosphaeria variabile]KAJ4346631.1 hypothetical protein N0V89_010562 [Didymosphaeria variabile]
MMASSMFLTPRALGAYAVVILLFLTIRQLGTTHATYNTSEWKGKVSHLTGSSGPKPANSTLDFQEIVYISMPYRTDRQDAMVLTAAQTGLKLNKMIKGVPSADVHEKARPLTNHPGDDPKKPWLGVWRAHADAWRYMIDNDIQSALIMEDDVDWDVNVKEVFGLWNWQMKNNNSLAENLGRGKNGETCEYGCDWDHLSMGQCVYKAHPTDHTHFSYNDPNSPAIGSFAKDNKKEMVETWKYKPEDAGVRLVTPSYAPLCTMGYAMTQRGARRALYQIGGFLAMDSPIDLEFIQHAKDGRLKSYTISPPTLVKWKVFGPGDTDNDYGFDFKANPDQDTTQGGGQSKGLLSSARQALKALDGKFHTWKTEDKKGDKKGT